jgi:mono/diheme cytochrome c family protein
MRHLILAFATICFGAVAVLARSGPPARNQHIALGKQVFESNCASCHGPGIGNPGANFRPGTDALRVKYNGTLPALLEERTDLTPETVAYFVHNGVSVMAPFRKTEIDDTQLAALGAYLGRNNPDLKPNQTGQSQ